MIELLRLLRTILGLVAAFFLYQLSVFFYQVYSDWRKGENGITAGLMLLLGGLLLKGVFIISESAYRSINEES